MRMVTAELWQRARVQVLLVKGRPGVCTESEELARVAEEPSSLLEMSSKGTLKDGDRKPSKATAKCVKLWPGPNGAWISLWQRTEVLREFQEEECEEAEHVDLVGGDERHGDHEVHEEVPDARALSVFGLGPWKASWIEAAADRPGSQAIGRKEAREGVTRRRAQDRVELMVKVPVDEGFEQIRVREVAVRKRPQNVDLEQLKGEMSFITKMLKMFSDVSMARLARKEVENLIDTSRLRRRSFRRLRKIGRGR